jgi:hypothetical protein
MNDAVVVDTAPSDPAPAFETLTVGVSRAIAAGYHAFADDVVIAHQHIGCG